MLDRNSHIPLHVQMETLMREKLDSGEWAPGQMIPSENELSAAFGVSRMTVRNVVTKLVHEGLLDRVAGKGTFVLPQKISASPLSYAGIREQLEKKGYQVSTQLLSLEQTRGDAKLCYHFGLREGAPFQVIRRIRFVKGVPLSLHTSYVPAALCPSLDPQALEDQQLCVILNQSQGLTPAKTEETLESVAATEEEARLLAVSAGHPLLLLQDTTYNEAGQPYEFSKVVFRGDKIVIHLSY
jgi:GntR family transcriptional regulator